MNSVRAGNQQPKGTRMARARKKPLPETVPAETASGAASTPEPVPAIDTSDEQTTLRQQTADIVQGVADGTAMPEERQADGFAAKVGKREPGYTQQGTTDYIAGVRIHEYHNAEAKKFLTIIKFDEKPSREVTSTLRKAGFDFSYENQEWNRPIRFETRQQDRINADEVFAEVCKLVRESKGVSHSFGGQAIG